MTSTSFKIGFGGSPKNSSRVLKPPGGGHTDLFGEAEEPVPHARPKYDQQNSSNLNFCMNTTDPNILAEQKKRELNQLSAQKTDPAQQDDVPKVAPASKDDQSGGDSTSTRGRVPPGGFSSGLW